MDGIKDKVSYRWIGTFLVILCLLCVLAAWSVANGMEVEPKLIIGSVHLQEHGVKEGNKFMNGISVTFSGGDKVYWSVTPEIWKMGEPLDEDTEIPNMGYSLHSQVGYRLMKTKNLEVTPVVGLNIGKLERDGQNPKWIDSKLWGYTSWTHLTYVFPTTGVNLKYKFLYGKFNLIWPVYWEGDTNSASSGKIQPHEPHLFLETGVIFGNFSVGAFYRKMSFDQLESNTYLSGGLVGYKF
jgi:hypothetical protein